MTAVKLCFVMSGRIEETRVACPRTKPPTGSLRAKSVEWQATVREARR